MFPPPILTDDQRSELQGTYVHRALVKELSGITKTLFGTDLLVADEAAKSVTLELHSTFEKKGFEVMRAEDGHGLETLLQERSDLLYIVIT